MIIFYAPDIESTFALPEADSKHCIRVLRKSFGDTVQVVDGQGNRFDCRIVDPNPRKTALEIIARHVEKPFWNYNVTVAVAPTKNIDRMEWLVEKLTEIGVNRIILLKCEHSERKEVKLERLEKIAVSAMKQSLKATLPSIEGPIKLDDFLTSTLNGQKFVGYCHPSIPKQLLSESIRPDTDVTVLIGPEGDFSPHEIELAIQNRFTPVTMGNNRLRTETAALVAADTVHIINQIKQ